MYECALTELLAEGVAEDVRPVLEQWSESPKAFAEAYEKLSRDSPAQAELARGLLPAGDAALAGGLRNEHLSLALRDFAKSLDETPTLGRLRDRRDQAWTRSPVFPVAPGAGASSGVALTLLSVCRKQLGILMPQPRLAHPSPTSP